MKVNSIINNDCLEGFQELTSKSVDLIYLDPPFYTQKKQKLSSKINKRYEFDDNWKSIIEYQKYIENRLKECKRVLKDTGSIFLHCDRNASHYLRIALDNVFNEQNFQSEIIWTYKRWSNAKKGLLNSHQIIFFYSKTKNFKFKPVYEDYSETTNIDQIFQKRVRGINGKSEYDKSTNGKVKLQGKKKGVPLGDVWEIPYLNPKAKERVGYPTQKPILLLERIIQLVTDKDDLVVDPFCGSGTTLVAAKLLNRNYIGMDISSEAIELTNARLENPIKTESLLMKNGRTSYINKNEYVESFLTKFSATRVQRNTGIDGFLKIRDNTLPIPIKIQNEKETLSEAITKLVSATKKNGFQKMILIQTKKHQSQKQIFSMEIPQNVFIIDMSKNE